MSKGKPIVASGAGVDRPRCPTALRGFLISLPLLLAQLPAAQAQVSVGIGIQLPGVSIGINLPTFPVLQQVPGYPVYYAPETAGNYFYYDGMYWAFQGDDWYASSWYNGPWQRVMPVYVPSYVLRVPVRYYRQPPAYFRHWRHDAPPRWDQHWGREWQQRRAGWNQWDRHAAPPPAPLPTYQRRYPQSRYPHESARQQAIRAENFDYRPREPVSRQAYQAPDRSSPYRQIRPVQQTQTWPAPAQAPRAQPFPPPRAQPIAQQPSPRHEWPPAAHPSQAPRPQAAPRDRSPQPGPQPNAQRPSRQEDRPQSADPSRAPRPQAAPQGGDRPPGRAESSNRRPERSG